jgi:hypothetical protein
VQTGGIGLRRAGAPEERQSVRTHWNAQTRRPASGRNWATGCASAFGIHAYPSRGGAAGSAAESLGRRDPTPTSRPLPSGNASRGGGPPPLQWELPRRRSGSMPRPRAFLAWSGAPLPLLRSSFSLLDQNPGFAPGAIILGPDGATGSRQLPEDPSVLAPPNQP